MYAVAYGNRWLDKGVQAEREADATITLLFAKVALGHCKDFGARCRSSRGDAAAAALGVAKGLSDWGPTDVGRRGESRGFSRPPARREAGEHELFNSVTGTEGDLAWTENPRLTDCGSEYGRQFITFETSQAYPELILQLGRKHARNAQFKRAAEQEALGKADKQMARGTVLVGAVARGAVVATEKVIYERFVPSRFGANRHECRVGEPGAQLDLRQSIRSMASPSTSGHSMEWRRTDGSPSESHTMSMNLRAMSWGVFSPLAPNASSESQRWIAMREAVDDLVPDNTRLIPVESDAYRTAVAVARSGSSAAQAVVAAHLADILGGDGKARPRATRFKALVLIERLNREGGEAFKAAVRQESVRAAVQALATMEAEDDGGELVPWYSVGPQFYVLHGHHRFVTGHLKIAAERVRDLLLLEPGSDEEAQHYAFTACRTAVDPLLANAANAFALFWNQTDAAGAKIIDCYSADFCEMHGSAVPGKHGERRQYDAAKHGLLLSAQRLFDALTSSDAAQSWIVPACIDSMYQWSLHQHVAWSTPLRRELVANILSVLVNMCIKGVLGRSQLDQVALARFQSAEWEPFRCVAVVALSAHPHFLRALPALADKAAAAWCFVDVRVISSSRCVRCSLANPKRVA